MIPKLSLNDFEKCEYCSQTKITKIPHKSIVRIIVMKGAKRSKEQRPLGALSALKARAFFPKSHLYYIYISI